MKYISKLLNNPLFSQVLRYLIVGVFNNIIYYLVFLSLLNLLGLHYSISMFIAFAISIFTGYLMNTKFTFKLPAYEKKVFIKYTSLYISAFFINLTVLYYLIDVQVLKPWFAQLIGTIFVAIYNFIFLKIYVYK